MRYMFNSCVHALAACVLVGAACSSAMAQAVTGSFITGQLAGDGFPGINSAPAVNMTAIAGSTSGSTGAGIGDAAAAISTSGSGIVISVTGSSTHSDNQNGYTSVFTSVFPVVRINRSASFTVTNTSRIGAVNVVPVIFEPVSGTGASITGNINTTGTLTAGDYRMRFAVVAGNTSAFPTSFNQSYAGYASIAAGYYSSATMNWRITISPPDTAVACCRGSTCSVVVASQCTGRSIAGATTCNAAGNAVTPCCKADFNQSQSVSVQDIFDFVNAWFAGNTLADFNGGGITVQDIFDFVGAWFVGCP